MKHPENNPKYRGINVNKGVDQPSPVNENSVKRFLKKQKKKLLASDKYVDGILKGDIAMLSKAITLVESNSAKHQEVAQEVISKCLPHTGKSIRVGITGIPGAGKSTFIEALGSTVTTLGRKLAVLAIDPSSQRSKGSILGDKTRMESLSGNPSAYIRPSPSAGSLGGVARKTRETIALCEAAGFDTIFIETVGVGQSEVLVHSMVDFFLLMQIAGAGDELQGVKRGIMEMADIIVVNKADGSNVEKAELAATQLRSALHLFPPTDSGLKVEVMTCSALSSYRIDEVWEALESYVQKIQSSGFFERRRSQQAKYWMYETINESLRDSFYKNPEIVKKLKPIEKAIQNDEMSSFVAAHKLLNDYYRTIASE